MKQTRLVLALIVTSLAATPVLAASLTMLQFGSFETRDEAEKKLSDVTSKYKESLAGLPTSIREVKLPPDNLTVFRTQAGPVADKSTAQTICNKLSGSGDECYIVQTAMINGVAPAVTVAANPMPAMMQQPSIDARDPNNRAALASVSTPFADGVATPSSNIGFTAGADQSADMRAALDQAVNDQPTIAADVNNSTHAAETSQRTGFWSHLNPFSTTMPTPAPVIATSTPNSAAPFEPVVTTSLAAPEVTVVPDIVTPPPPATIPVARPSVTAYTAPVAQAADMNPLPRPGFDSTPVITTPPVMQLPPPPAPLRAQDRNQLAASRPPLAAPEPVAAPIHVMPLPPGTPVGAPSMMAGAGTVQVEEARRVPVTSAFVAPMRQPAGAVPVATPFNQAPVSLLPNSTEGLKTIWAQIGPFASNDEALSYWATYRQNHPDFPVVRVRVTSSYQALLHGTNTYNLRVGPMAQKAFVSSLCASLNPPAGSDQPQIPVKQCGMVSDLGVSSSLGAPNSGMLSPSRYTNRH